MNKIIKIILLISLFSCVDKKLSNQDLIINSIKEVSPSVVSISIEAIDSKEQFGFGSGLIISDDGYIITNSHVVEIGNLFDVFVIISGGEKYLAQIIGIDKLTDIALLKIDKTELQFARLDNTNKLVRGQGVIALGNPHNLFSVSKEPTATVGIISGKNVNFGLRKSGHVYQNMIQTDASINRGNSGGPLVNLSGEVVGINTFIITESKGSGGIGFSIPISRVKDIIKDLKEKGAVDRTWFTGISVREIDQKYKDFFNINVESGVIVIDVEKQSPAENSGILLKDIIYKVNDRIVNSTMDIEEALDEGYFKTDDEVKLLIIRKNNFIKVNLKLINPYNK